MSGYPETMTGSDFCHVEGHLWRGGLCIRCYEQYRCWCGRFMKIEDMDAHFPHCPWVLAHKEETS